MLNKNFFLSLIVIFFCNNHFHSKTQSTKKISKGPIKKTGAIKNKKNSKATVEESSEDEEDKPSLAKDFIPEVDSIIIPEPVQEEVDEMSLIQQIAIVTVSGFALINVIGYLYGIFTTNQQYKKRLEIYKVQKGDSNGFDEAAINDPAINQDKLIHKPTNKILKNKDLKIFFNPHSIWESKWSRYVALAPAYGALKYIHGKKLWSTVDD